MVVMMNLFGIENWKILFRESVWKVLGIYVGLKIRFVRLRD